MISESYNIIRYLKNMWKGRTEVAFQERKQMQKISLKCFCSCCRPGKDGLLSITGQPDRAAIAAAVRKGTP